VGQAQFAEVAQQVLGRLYLRQFSHESKRAGSRQVVRALTINEI
jgi:hypothetical protein